jgi:hypothetical protein
VEKNDPTRVQHKLVLMGVDNFCVHKFALIHVLAYILGPLLMHFLGFFGPKDAFVEITINIITTNSHE